MKILSCEGATLTVILRIPITESVVLSACVAVFYTLIGGLYAVAYTDVIQLCSIMVGLVRPSMSMTECLVLAPFFANLFVKSAIVNFVKKIMQFHAYLRNSIVHCLRMSFHLLTKLAIDWRKEIKTSNFCTSVLHNFSLISAGKAWQLKSCHHRVGTASAHMHTTQLWTPHNRTHHTIVNTTQLWTPPHRFIAKLFLRTPSSRQPHNCLAISQT